MYIAVSGRKGRNCLRSTDIASFIEHFAGGRVERRKQRLERREQRRRPMADIVVRTVPHLAFSNAS